MLQQAPLAHPLLQLPDHVLPALPQQVALIQLIKHSNGHFLGTDLHITSSHMRRRKTCALTYDAIWLRGLYGVHLHLGVFLADAVLELGPNQLYQAPATQVLSLHDADSVVDLPETEPQVTQNADSHITPVRILKAFNINTVHRRKYRTSSAPCASRIAMTMSSAVAGGFTFAL